MPVTIASSGSQTATLNTDHTLASPVAPTGGAVYQLRVDTAALVNGERVILTLQTKARVGDTLGEMYSSVFENAQGDPIKDSPFVGVEDGNTVVAILRQEGGTGRAFPWAMRRMDG